MPNLLSGWPTRVSSAAMKSTWDNTSWARGEKSPRLPMGVETTYNVPAIRYSSSMTP